MAKCDCYHRHGNTYRCYGTRTMEECTCGGDQSKCNFYPEKREQKAQNMAANEKRLIDANAIIAKAEKRRDLHPKGSRARDSYNSIIGFIKYNSSTVDAVEVVRCKDCKHYKPQEKSAKWHGTVDYCNRSVSIKMPPDGFCSCGERKDNGC